ncbi:MAG: NfeD family protein [Acidimicrobiales bacterium]
MWIVAEVLLGLVVLGLLIGLHSGPHAHIGAGAIGVIGAAWLVFMAVDGRSAPVLWALLLVDLAVSVAVVALAWKGLSGRHTVAPVHHPIEERRLGPLEASEGVAVSDLTPEGIVRVRGEEWSAVSVNGPVPADTKVQVLRAGGVRLEVWGENGEVAPRERFEEWYL